MSEVTVRVDPDKPDRLIDIDASVDDVEGILDLRQGRDHICFGDFGVWRRLVAAVDALLETREQPKDKDCDHCQYRGHGWHKGQHYRKCMEHSLPCDDLGNVCGRFLPVEPLGDAQ